MKKKLEGGYKVNISFQWNRPNDVDANQRLAEIVNYLQKTHGTLELEATQIKILNIYRNEFEIEE